MECDYKIMLFFFTKVSVSIMFVKLTSRYIFTINVIKLFNKILVKKICLQYFEGWDDGGEIWCLFEDVSDCNFVVIELVISKESP